MSSRIPCLGKTCVGSAVAAALALVALPAAAKTPAPGEVFPALQAAALEGTLPDLTAARVVIVDFWASWCAPCKASFPVFDAIQRDYAAKGVVIVAVNVDRSAAAMEAFLRRMKPGFAVVRDGAQKLVGQAAPPTMPTSFVLDRHGVVRFVHAGFLGEKSRREFLEQIDQLLAEES